MGQLAEIHSDRGLPRGRGSLPAAEVGDAQRDRLLRAIVAASAELGYANVRITDLVQRARVSRQSFYAQFADKEACFLAAHSRGIELIVGTLARWIDDPDADPRVRLRAGIDAYFGMAASEPEFARCMLVELQAIGPAGLAARLDAHRRIEAVLRAWHAAARQSQPDWPAIPDGRYPAAVGAVHDLIFELVADPARTRSEPPAEAAYDAVLTLLLIPSSSLAT